MTFRKLREIAFFTVTLPAMQFANFVIAICILKTASRHNFWNNQGC